MNVHVKMVFGSEGDVEWLSEVDDSLVELNGHVCGLIGAEDDLVGMSFVDDPIVGNRVVRLTSGCEEVEVVARVIGIVVVRSCAVCLMREEGMEASIDVLVSLLLAFLRGEDVIELAEVLFVAELPQKESSFVFRTFILQCLQSFVSRSCVAYVDHTRFVATSETSR